MKLIKGVIRWPLQRSLIKFRGHFPSLLLSPPTQQLPNLSFSRFSSFRSAFVGFHLHQQRWLSVSSQSMQLFENLRRGTDELIDIASGKSQKEETRNLDDCENMLQDWLEHAEIGGEYGFAAAEEAHRLFNVLYENTKNEKSTDFTVQYAFQYNMVIHAFSISKHGRHGAERAQTILMQMLQDCKDYISDHKLYKFPPPEPDDIAFNCVIEAWARSGEKDAGDRAQELLFVMGDWRKSCTSTRQNDESFPYTGCQLYKGTLVATIAALSDTKGGPDKALDMVMNYINVAKEWVDSRGSVEGLNAYVFNSLMEAYVKSGRGIRTAEKVEEIFRLMSKVNIEPTNATFVNLLDAWSQAEGVDGSGLFAQKADNCLRKMIDSYRSGSNVKPTVRTFNTVILAWARCRSISDAPDRAESLFKLLIELYENTGEKDFRPSVVTGNVLVTLWSRARRRPDSMTRAKQALDSMKRFDQPNLITFNALIDGYAKRGMGKEALELLLELIKESSNGNTHPQPDLITYNTVLNALAKGKSPESAEQAQLLLEKMDSDAASGQGVQPDTIAYNSVISAWSRSAGMLKGNKGAQMKAAENAATILNRMIALFEQKKEIKPDVISFNACIAAWSRCDHPSSPEQAERLYNILVQLFERTGDADFRPDVVTTSGVVTAWSRATRYPDSMKRAVQIVEQSEQYASPDIRMYNSLLDGYAKRGLAKEAYTLFNNLKKLIADGKLNGKLDTISYNSVLNALAKDKKSYPSQLVECSDKLLEEMKANRQRSPEAKPDRISYQCVIDTWSKLSPSSVERFERANALIREMIDAANRGDADLKPNAIDVISFLKSFSHSSGKPEHGKMVIDTVFEAFGTLKHCDVNERDYLDYIMAIDRNVKQTPDRRRLLEQLFCHAGEGKDAHPSIVRALQELSPNVVPTKLDKHSESKR